MVPQLGRKRVRFEEDSERQVKRQVVEVPKVPVEEKKNLWYQKQEFQTILEGARREVRNSSANRQSSTNFYANALASAFAACCAAKKGQDIPEQISSQLVMGAIFDGNIQRGLERVTVMNVGMERLLRRSQTIKLLVQIQGEIKDQDLLGGISEEMSRPARLLAKAFGTADATSALIEYHNSEQQTSTRPSLTPPVA